MKVTGIKVTQQSHPLSRRMGEARLPAGRLTESCCIMELMTDAGLTGIAIGSEGVRAHIGELVKDVLVGADPRGVRGLWRRMLDARSAHRHGRYLHEAIALLDVALWDLKSKADDQPLWKTLGGARPKANAYASGVDLALSDEELSAWYVATAHDYGLRGGKLQVGLDPDSDLRRLGLMHAALTQATADPVLMIDADECWSPKEAIGRTREIEKRFDLTWVEGASRSWDFPGLKQVSNAIRAAVCVGEGFTTCGEFLPHFHHRSADVIQIDIGAIGITGALQVADSAFGYELPVTLSAAPGNIHAHLSSVMPYFMSLEVIDPVPAARFYTSDVRIEQGWAIAGNAPGNGLVVDARALTRTATRAKASR
jgi:L-alanine-DL-glutamate epimerase-like enolase superfamily enzyme